MGAQWLSGGVLDLRLWDHRFEPHRRHCVVSLSKNINPSLVLVQPRKTGPFITERLFMGHKESNQIKQKHPFYNTPHYNEDLDIIWSCCGFHFFGHGILQKNFRRMAFPIILSQNCPFKT